MDGKKLVGTFVIAIIFLQLYFYLSSNNHKQSNGIKDDLNFEGHEGGFCGVEDDDYEEEQLKDLISKLESENLKLSQQNKLLQETSSSSLISSSQEHIWAHLLGHPIELFVQYPSAGINLRKLLSNHFDFPVYSVYNKQSSSLDIDNIDVSEECFSENECILSEGFPRIIQTFYPTLLLQPNLPSKTSKILQIIQNPADAIHSCYSLIVEEHEKMFSSRTREWKRFVEYETSELKKFLDFWEIYVEDQRDSVHTFVLRIEDLCLKPAEFVDNLISFLQIPVTPRDYSYKMLLESIPSLCKKYYPGYSFIHYSPLQIETLSNSFSYYIKAYNYTDLYASYAINE